MTNVRLMLTAAALTGAACVSLMVNRAAAQEPVKPQLDRPKRAIERPTELLVGRAMPGAGAVADGRGVAAFVNPKVAPGKVQWRASFAAACEAAQKSGKPVLLFQLLGQLDQQFT